MDETRKNSLSREEAASIYDDLQRTMNDLITKTSTPAPAKRAAPARPTNSVAAARKPHPYGMMSNIPSSGPAHVAGTAAGVRSGVMAFSFVILFAAARVVTGFLEYAGIIGVMPAEASMNLSAPTLPVLAAGGTTTNYSPEQVEILTALDLRRAELEERNKKLDERQTDLDTRDREFTVRMAQLKELTERLANEREKNEQKRNTQFEQLANVYSSMSPNEAATLIQQLDITIALHLLERMPEKKIAQILALMKSDKALTITKMLSSKVP